MRKRLLILLLLIVVLVFGMIFLSRKTATPATALPPQTANTNSITAGDPSPQIGNAVQGNTNTNALSNIGNQHTRPTNNLDSATSDENIRAMIESKNVPITFFGEVIDQDSNLLSGVKIDAWIRHWNTTSWGALNIGSETDANGRFLIDDVTGDGVSIESMSKSGYEKEPGQVNFGPENGTFFGPVVFKMWNTNAHEQLITGSEKFKIIPDGRQYVIDLSKNSIAESGNGDLKIWVKCSGNVARGQLSDWSCEIAVINGGLLEEPLGSTMFAAPSQGYVPTFQLQQQIKSGQRGSIGTRQFFISLDNGQKYGHITIELYAPFNDEVPGLIRLSYAINPSGSRVLY